MNADQLPHGVLAVLALIAWAGYALTRYVERHR
jgi:hypothetical protein